MIIRAVIFATTPKSSYATPPHSCTSDHSVAAPHASCATLSRAVWSSPRLICQYLTASCSPAVPSSGVRDPAALQSIDVPLAGTIGETGSQILFLEISKADLQTKFGFT